MGRDSIKELRYAAGLEQAEAAKLLYVSKSYVNHVESGRRNTPAGWADLLRTILAEHPDTRMYTVAAGGRWHHVSAVSLPAALHAIAARISHG